MARSLNGESSRLSLVPLSAYAAERAWLSTSLPPNPGTVVLIGAGTGQGLGALLDRESELRAVVLEPDPRAAESLRTHLANRPETASRVAILSGPTYADGADVADRFTDVGRAPVLVEPSLERSHPREVARARNIIAALARRADEVNGTRRVTAGRCLLQTLANAPRLARESDIDVIGGLMGGLPAVIVAAGPSLDENVRELAPLVDRAVIIACDTAARPLVHHGIEPHFIVATESSRANVGHLAALPVGESWLVAEGSLHPSALASFAHRTFYFATSDHEPWPWLTSLGLPRTLLAASDSVLTAAYAFATHVGCNPIVFAGTDLAFTSGRPYCRGTVFESQWATWAGGGTPLEEVWRTLVDGWPETWAPDVRGTDVRTAPHLVALKRWVLTNIARARHARVVNATQAGILHGPGIDQGSLAAVLTEADAIDGGRLQRVIRSAHHSGAKDVSRLLEGVTGLLSGVSEHTFAAWMQSSAGTIGYPAIEAALRSPEHAAWMLARRSAVKEAR